MRHYISFEEIDEDFVRVEIKSENGDIEYLNIGRLPPVGAGRQAMVSSMVETHIADRAYRRKRALLKKTRVEGLTEKLQNSASPPPFAELIISCLAPKNTAQAQLGDLHEMFESNIARLGEQQARRKYWMQVASSLWPLLLQWLKRIGFITMLVDYLRSKIGF